MTIAGEWFTPDLVQAHYDRLPGVALFNEYGPAENAVCSTIHPLSAGDPTILIGRPIDNVSALVVREDGTPATAGEVGELYLGGAGLARGYYGNAELTAEKFPLWQPPGGQPDPVYRSGDFVRLHETGDLQFIGRQDRQVKIRGRRVELDHIATCLTGDPQVSDGHVPHYESASGTPYIVAFIVSPESDPERLLTVARESLPSYMVPSAIIGVGEIPLTRSGKVDEEALLEIYRQLMAGGQPAAAGRVELPAVAAVAVAEDVPAAHRRARPRLLRPRRRLAPGHGAGRRHRGDLFGIQLESSDVYRSQVGQESGAARRPVQPSIVEGIVMNQELHQSEFTQAPHFDGVDYDVVIAGGGSSRTVPGQATGGCRS